VKRSYFLHAIAEITRLNQEYQAAVELTQKVLARGTELETELQWHCGLSKAEKLLKDTNESVDAHQKAWIARARLNKAKAELEAELLTDPTIQA
jgi:hypothetical protein